MSRIRSSVFGVHGRKHMILDLLPPACGERIQLKFYLLLYENIKKYEAWDVYCDLHKSSCFLNKEVNVL